MSMTLIFLISVAVIGVIAGALVFEKNYEDGVVGRAALGLVALMATAIIFSGILEDRYEQHGETVLLTAGVAVFMARHYYRFLMYTKFGIYLWGESQSQPSLKESDSCQAKTRATTSL